MPGRWLAACCLALWLLLPVAAAAPSPPADKQPAVSAEELQRLVTTLQDDTARARLIEQLQALIAAQRAAAPPHPAPALPARLSARVDALAGEILAAAGIVHGAPRIFGWLHRQLGSPAAWHDWAALLLRLVLAFAGAALAEWLCRRVLAPFPARAGPAVGRSRPVAALFALLAFTLDIVPVLVFAAAAWLVLTLASPPFSPDRVAATIPVEATVIARLILRIAHFMLLGGERGLVPFAGETRTYLYIWVRRFTLWAVGGNAAAAAAWWLGAPGAVPALVLKLVALVLAGFAVIFILQNRLAVAQWLAGPPPEVPADGGWRRVRRSCGEIWHVVAILYVVGIYVIYALRVEGGIVFILRATVLSLVVLVAARLLARFVNRLARRGFAVSPELAGRFPTLDQRVNRYVPIVSGLGAAVIYLLAALFLLQAWNVQSFAWLGSAPGRRIGGTLLSIAVVVLVALFAWELLAAAIERHLAALDAAGAPRRARLRTLLPLLRTTLLIGITLIVVLTVMSQIGIDIAPLLAGAGVVGLAIGFGSQTLVKDVITGLFILVEDQIAVGDIVDVGKDHRGTVEAISVRTIRLRDQSGTVHTVPFSEVTSVKNLTRDYSYAVARVTVSYREDIDRVVEVLREAANELAEDESLQPQILDPFDFQGVDALDDFSLTLLVRIRTMPGRQLAVGRAFNRRVKLAFDRHGIASRDPNPVVVTGLPAALREMPRAAVSRG